MSDSLRAFISHLAELYRESQDLPSDYERDAQKDAELIRLHITVQRLRKLGTDPNTILDTAWKAIRETVVPE